MGPQTAQSHSDLRHPVSSRFEVATVRSQDSRIRSNSGARDCLSSTDETAEPGNGEVSWDVFGCAAAPVPSGGKRSVWNATSLA
jgi:hypothetical protein